MSNSKSSKRSNEDMLRLIETGYAELQKYPLYASLESEAVQILDMVPTVGFDAAHKCLVTMYTYDRNNWTYGSDQVIVSGLDKYVGRIKSKYGITRDMIDGRMKMEHKYFPPETHETIALALMHIMAYDKNTFVRVDAYHEMQYLKKSKNARAKDILDFGTGAIPPQYRKFKNENVKISANDVKWWTSPPSEKKARPAVQIDILNECEEAYAAAPMMTGTSFGPTAWHTAICTRPLNILCAMCRSKIL